MKGKGRDQIGLTFGIWCLLVILPCAGYGANLTIGNNVSTTGNWTVNGTINATSFSGDGSGLSNVQGTVPQEVLDAICHLMTATPTGLPCPTFCDCNKIVFVSSGVYTGNLGGSGGADAKCQALATAAGMRGTFKAWLSDSTAGPSTRFVRSFYPYVRVDGVVIANNWQDLVDGSLLNPINVTEGRVELGEPYYMPDVWTNTKQDGSPDCADAACSSCAFWTDGTSASLGSGGSHIEVGPYWTTGALGNCDWEIHIYCFEQ